MLENWLAHSDLLLAGGWVIGAILLLTFLMWLLILERYLALRIDTPRLVSGVFERWHRERGPDTRANSRLRAALTAAFRVELAGPLGLVQVITAILPLLGLLGTVTGMITTFEVMTVFGTGNVRGMAGGISQALITTMAGLITALTGLYFANDLEHRIDGHTDHLAGHLNDAEDAAS